MLSSASNRIGLCRLGWLWILPCYFLGSFAVGQEFQLVDEPIDNLPELIELQFGVHTSPTGERSWNVGIKIVSTSGNEHIALNAAEEGILKIADGHIDRVLLSQYLTSSEIIKLRTTARVQAKQIVRRSDAFLREVQRYPLEFKTMPRLQEKIGEFKRENAGELFGPLSLFARTLRTMAR